MIVSPDRNVRSIAIVGAESTGKSTLALMLTGRLRTHGVQAVMVAEPGNTLPFPPSMLDTHWPAWLYMVTHKMALESQTALRPNVGFMVSDRSVIDHIAYAEVRGAYGLCAHTLNQLAWTWMAHYDAVYFLPTEGTEYVEDGFRMPAKDNDFRADVNAWFEARLDSIAKYVPETHRVTGSYRERGEWIYHHVLHTFLGKSRPLRAYEQVRDWLRQRGWRVLEVRPQGSNSVTRFHPSSDHDDIDAIVVVEGDANYAILVRQDIEAHRTQLENIVQADLDLLVTPAGLEAHEA
jgi:nicotinamide riboside kinase